MSAQLLAPLCVLVLWTLLVLFWMISQRIPAMKGANLPPEMTVGGRGQDLERLLPGKLHWSAHNYAHLLEQPVIFYATVLGLAVLGQATPLNVGLAWAYVGLRIVHSLWQVFVNTIPVRASLFFLSTFVLAALAVNATIAAFSVS
jgi:hypothetical protein